MKKVLIFGFVIVLIISCAINRIPNVFIGNWTERQLPFSESIEFEESNDLLRIITLEKWCCSQDNYKYEWLRKKKNLQATFSILKKIGIKRFISGEQFNEKLFEDDYWNYDWEGLSLNNVVKNMITSYNVDLDSSNYFQKFWKRRKAENNEKIVLKILLEVNDIYNSDKQVTIDENTINPILFELIKYNVELNESDSLNKPKITLKYFDYLKEIGLEHSAYNLIFEIEATKKLAINRDSILRILKYDTISEETYWQTRNDASWIKTYKDNGP